MAKRKVHGFREKSFRKHWNGSKNVPLRKVIKLVLMQHPDYPKLTVERELLECGHLIPVRFDYVGRTNAERRRCRKCRIVAERDRERGIE